MAWPSRPSASHSVPFFSAGAAQHNHLACRGFRLSFILDQWRRTSGTFLSEKCPQTGGGVLALSCTQRGLGALSAWSRLLPIHSEPLAFIPRGVVMEPTKSEGRHVSP